MKKVKVNSKEFIVAPQHIGDAGFDVIAASDPVIVGKQQLGYYFSSVDYIEYDTNIIIEPEKNYHTLVLPRSSISKTNLLLANSVGLIDNGYRGTIKLRFKYIAQPQDFVVNPSGVLIEVNSDRIYKKGDRIGQLVFSKTVCPELVFVNDFSKTSRSEGGFGSTGA